MRSAIESARESPLAHEVEILAKASYVLVQGEDSGRWAKELAGLEGRLLAPLDIAIQLILATQCGEIVRAKSVLPHKASGANNSSI